MTFYIRRDNFRRCFERIERCLYEHHERLWGDLVAGYLGEHEEEVLSYSILELSMYEYENEIGYFFNEALYLRDAWVRENTCATAISQPIQPRG
jgi:hypothetical protein